MVWTRPFSRGGLAACAVLTVALSAGMIGKDAVLRGGPLWQEVPGEFPAGVSPDAGGKRNDSDSAIVPARFALRPDGTIPVWLIAGPFEQPTTGFGVPVDTDLLGESGLHPAEGNIESSHLAAGGTVGWFAQSADGEGYLDLNTTAGSTQPGTAPQKVWFDHVIYAFVSVESDTTHHVNLLAGSNSRMWVRFNGEQVHRAESPRPARRDQDTVRIRLTKGENTILFKIDNSHHNLGPTFFGGPGWGWGLFARLVDPRTGRAPPVHVRVDVPGNPPPPLLRSTFFFRETGGTLLQRFDLWADSRSPEPSTATLSVRTGGRTRSVALSALRFGRNRVETWLPAVSGNVPVEVVLSAGGRSCVWNDTLREEPRYEMHLMQLTHMDIGYTHPQPVTAELNVRALDEVLDLCRTEPEFRWTVETLWQLEQFERARPPSSRGEIAARIREGRIALSPLYSNPFTGWVSEEEMVRSLAAARRWAGSDSVRFRGAVVNDLPGVSWRMPGLLRDAGVEFLACGLNEVYQDYTLQRALPKAFRWEGPDGASVIVYRNETYVEGSAYGLEHDTTAIAYRVWSRLNHLRTTGNDHRLVLVNAGWFDNGPPARNHFLAARAWNMQYRYPRFVFSTINAFAERFVRAYRDSLPVLRGDWTSAWDIQYQGEPARVRLHRWAQHQLVSAATLASIAYLQDSVQLPFLAELDGAYRMLLNYSGHGSGLEAGYGTVSENVITMDYRERYVRDAALTARDVLLRSMARLAKPEESLEGEGLLVWNPLPWERDIPMEIERKADAAGKVSVSDGVQAVAAHAEGNLLRVVAPAVPPMGYRKLFLRPGKSVPPGDTLVVASDGIQNRFFAVRADSKGGGIYSLIHRRTGRDLVDRSGGEVFGALHRARPLAGEKFAPLLTDSVEVRILDRRPVSLTLAIRRPGHLNPETRVTLWAGVDRVDMVQAVNLEALREPGTVEEYGVAFPFSLLRPRFRAEILGGFVEEGERLPGAATDGFSIRRVVALSEDRQTVLLSMADGRVALWTDRTGSGRKTLFANVVNNFPVSWNRNEENRGTIEFRFSLSVHAGAFNPGRASRFGWESVMEPVVNATWLRSAEPARSAMSVESENVILTGLVPSEEGRVLLRLRNVNRQAPADAIVRSEFLRGRKAWRSNAMEQRHVVLPVRGESLRLTIPAGATSTIILE